MGPEGVSRATPAYWPVATNCAAIHPVFPFGARTFRQVMPSAARSAPTISSGVPSESTMMMAPALPGCSRSRAPEPPVPRTTAACDCPGEPAGGCP